MQCPVLAAPAHHEVLDLQTIGEKKRGPRNVCLSWGRVQQVGIRGEQVYNFKYTPFPSLLHGRRLQTQLIHYQSATQYAHAGTSTHIHPQHIPDTRAHKHTMKWAYKHAGVQAGTVRQTYPPPLLTHSSCAPSFFCLLSPFLPLVALNHLPSSFILTTVF
jgi:hypothetical protein